MSIYCLDANIFIDPWERDYPISIFPTLWKKLSECRNNFIILKEIFNEIDPLTSGLTIEERKEKHPLRTWLEDNKITSVPIPKEIQESSVLLEKTYKIQPNPSKGANQNDLLLIAYAKENKKILVTLERDQTEPPQKKSNYKIPLICRKENIECINYVEFLKRLQIKI